jgi:hypothetical protein
MFPNYSGCLDYKIAEKKEYTQGIFHPDPERKSLEDPASAIQGTRD